ncbi:MAG: RNA polymerase sigma factor [Planctomycetota bacterium]
MERIVLRPPRTRPLVPAEEEALVARARGGEPAAFDALVRAHYARIRSTAFHLLGNPEDAEDLAQECFVRAHGALRWYRGEAGLFAWLRTILVHLARDRFRRERRRPAPGPLSGAAEPAVDRGPLVEAGARELVQLVAEGLRRLPDPLRIAFVLRALDGLDYEEVARATGVRPATARTQVMKARRALERFLGPYLAEGER